MDRYALEESHIEDVYELCTQNISSGISERKWLGLGKGFRIEPLCFRAVKVVEVSNDVGSFVAEVAGISYISIYR